VLSSYEERLNVIYQNVIELKQSDVMKNASRSFLDSGAKVYHQLKECKAEYLQLKLFFQDMLKGWEEFLEQIANMFSNTLQTKQKQFSKELSRMWEANAEANAKANVYAKDLAALQVSQTEKQRKYQTTILTLNDRLQKIKTHHQGIKGDMQNIIGESSDMFSQLATMLRQSEKERKTLYTQNMSLRCNLQEKEQIINIGKQMHESIQKDYVDCTFQSQLIENKLRDAELQAERMFRRAESMQGLNTDMKLKIDKLNSEITRLKRKHSMIPSPTRQGVENHHHHLHPHEHDSHDNHQQQPQNQLDVNTPPRNQQVLHPDDNPHLLMMQQPQMIHQDSSHHMNHLDFENEFIPSPVHSIPPALGSPPPVIFRRPHGQSSHNPRLSSPGPQQHHSSSLLQESPGQAASHINDGGSLSEFPNLFSNSILNSNSSSSTDNHRTNDGPRRSGLKRATSDFMKFSSSGSSAAEGFGGMFVPRKRHMTSRGSSMLARAMLSPTSVTMAR